MYTPEPFDPTSAMSAEQVRLAIRRGAGREAMAALSTRWVRAQLVLLPSEFAGDFRDFCLRNPQACPLLATSEPGRAMVPALGDDLDLRGDLAAYEVWREGAPRAELVDKLVAHWRRDLVGFVIAAGSAYEQRLGPATVYSTQRASAPAGPFGGPLKVGLRVLEPQQAIEAIEVSARHGELHGRPVHLGDPAALGIADLARPEQGAPCDLSAPGLPVFWASGLTALAAARGAGADLCITNAPGALLVTDLLHPPLADASKR